MRTGRVSVFLSSGPAGFWIVNVKFCEQGAPSDHKGNYVFTFYILIHMFSNGGLQAGIIVIRFYDTSYSHFWHELIIYSTSKGKHYDIPPFALIYSLIFLLIL